MQRISSAAAAAMMLAGAIGAAQASSHREAPFITEVPKVDGTDFYMFRSYEAGRSDFVTFIANYVPLQDAYGGPNYFALDPEALYEIHVDNDGDAVEDITFAFDFTQSFTPLRIDTGNGPISIPLVNSGAIGPGAGDTANLHVSETYTLTVARSGRRSTDRQLASNVTAGGTTFRKPVDNIGNKSIGDYPSYADAHIWDVSIPGCGSNGRVFVGQRAEGFVVNLGEVFDLVNTDPLGSRSGETNVIAGKNITSIALEVPVSCLTDGDPVIGAWTTASLRQARALNPVPQGPVTDRTATPRVFGPAVEGGAYTQVSRLGSPLVNEVVIGIDQKDLFNASRPQTDLQRFATFVTHPTLPVLVDLLFFGGEGASVPATPRNDLVAAFVTGIRTDVNGTPTNFTQPQAITAGTGTPGEMLRLNTAFPAEPTPFVSQSDLAFLDCDLSGFPNGRRPIDDVVDIALTVAMGAIAENPNNLQTCDVSGPAPVVVNEGAVVTDGALPSAEDYLTVFPYLDHPRPGSTSPAVR